MADRFVRVRLLRIQHVDLKVFEFDWDLTWAVFFMHPDGKVYGRYGGRDASGADSRNTLLGLRYAIEAALESHEELADQPPPKRESPLIITKLAAAKRSIRGNECLHCHQIKEIFREEEKDRGVWKRESLWTYPLPENVGITFDPDKGNIVRKVAEESPAARVDLQPGDVVDEIGSVRVRSFADVQYALHKAPWTGATPITWKRDDKLHEAKLVLEEGWKKTNVTWRPSMLDLLPALTIYGADLTAEEKQKLGLAPKQLAFRQNDPVHSRARAMGVRAGDIIIGIDDRKLEMTVTEFLGYIRRNFIVGDRVTLNLIREGKRMDLAVKLGN